MSSISYKENKELNLVIPFWSNTFYTSDQASANWNKLTVLPSFNIILSLGFKIRNTKGGTVRMEKYADTAQLVLEDWSLLHF